MSREQLTFLQDYVIVDADNRPQALVRGRLRLAANLNAVHFFGTAEAANKYLNLLRWSGPPPYRVRSFTARIDDNGRCG